ncbi:hypothetical protein [Stutzerimonas stutzeri]|uniref:hypothetical protein n=1 Tax=Stutzerimonas stutzeri TaxID=316 RepID=UPI00210E1143|nr:hypothetical protein [Stutzerimonas stutzeri]MCQ4320081.1 hypothetical protein [Stutzerimonas stutzeri]
MFCKSLESYRERYGIEDVEEMLATFRPILERWTQLVDAVEFEEDLTKLYWDQVYSTVDVENYGL